MDREGAPKPGSFSLGETREYWHLAGLVCCRCDGDVFRVEASCVARTPFNAPIQLLHAPGPDVCGQILGAHLQVSVVREGFRVLRFGDLRLRLPVRQHFGLTPHVIFLKIDAALLVGVDWEAFESSLDGSQVTGDGGPGPGLFLFLGHAQKKVEKG